MYTWGANETQVKHISVISGGGNEMRREKKKAGEVKRRESFKIKQEMGPRIDASGKKKKAAHYIEHRSR